jgi:hypothetical protein
MEMLAERSEAGEAQPQASRADMVMLAERIWKSGRERIMRTRI